MILASGDIAEAVVLAGTMISIAIMVSALVVVLGRKK